MNAKHILLAGGSALLVVGLIALPGTSRSLQDATRERAQDAAPQTLPPPPGTPRVNRHIRIMEAPQSGAVVLDSDDDPQEFALAFDDGAGSWLGVETQEVTAEKAKSLKLSAERGVFVEKVLEDSPAAKAGLKDNDVITEINGQRVEGTAQFRRMIREIPAGRTMQLTVWRDGRSQNVNATLGKMQENHKQWMGAMPQNFHFTMPDLPEVTQLPGMQNFEWNMEGPLMGRPRLGIDAEDLSGQLGSYFGAPEGEGVLVREVLPESAAEKAGLKAGDVITTLNGERIHGLAELRSKIADSGEGKTAKLGVLRNKTALTLDVEIPAAKHKAVHKMELRTKI